MTDISNEHLGVTISERGAEPVSVRYHGRERLWQNGNGSWAGHAPVLFPVAGNCKMRVGGTEYPLPRHGFARSSLFTLRRAAADSATFTLAANRETRKVYPYDFVLSVTYTLRGNALETAYLVENPAKAPLFFACGGHLSHALAENCGAHMLRFPEEEIFTTLEHDENGLLTGQTSDMGRGKTLCLTDDFFRDGQTFILGGVKSRSVTLVSRTLGPLAEVGFAGFENLLLWRPKGARMLCIEPWSNLPDAAGSLAEFPQKAGVFEVPAGGSKTCAYTVTYF